MSYAALCVTKICSSFNEGINALTVKELPRSALKKKQVRIEVRAASVNYFDLLQLVGKYQMKPSLPFSPGAEAAGVISEVGSDVKNVKVGDKVIVAMGMTGGTMAEEIIYDAKKVMPMPSTLTFEQASGFGVGYFTGYHGLVDRGNLREGETLLVTGAAGGMGVAAIQLGKALGAIVVASASTDEKLEFCKKMGADHVINYKTQDMKAEMNKITKGKFADVVYENVGGDVFTMCTRCIGSGGRLLVIGFASGKIPQIPANIPLIKGFSVVGVRSGAEMQLKPKMTENMTTELLKLGNQGKLVPHVHMAVPLDRAKEAFSAISDRKVQGKAVITMGKPAKL